MAENLPQKIIDQIDKAGLPVSGQHPFEPSILKNLKGEFILEKKAIQVGPKKGKRGFVDDQGRIWIKDRAHADVPDHWDVQLEGGEEYFRVDLDGNEIL